MMWRTGWVIGCMVLVYFAGIWPAHAQEFKWAYVDLPHAMRSVEKGKKVFEELKTMKDRKQKELERDEQALRRSGEEVKKQQNVLSEDALMRRNRELAQMQLDLQRKAESYEMELMQAQNEYAQDILTEMDVILKRIAEKDGYAVIFERSGSQLVYADAKHDLTQRLIDEYNKAHGSALSKSRKRN